MTVNPAIIRLVVGFVALGFATWRARKDTRAKIAGRLGWTACAFSLSAFVLRDVTELGSTLPSRWTSAALAAIAGVAAFAALFLLSERETPKFQRVREALEAIVIVGSLCVTAWVVFVGDLVAGSQRGAFDKFLLVASPVGAAAIAVYALQSAVRTPGGRSSLLSYAGGTGAIFTAESLVAVDRLQLATPHCREPVTLVLMALGYALIALSATQRTKATAAS